ncbi:DUF1569 domain-containing protein [Flavisericum labens]|uniref:DUF1569 domain-containing protein n=1 Tax=Flavisericum labens TaxID=3377112 RepID=UPI00387B6241
MDILNQRLSQIEKFISYHEQKNTKVSNSSIGWHLHHSLQVINGVCGILLKTKPENYKRNFNLKRAILFPLGYIPRGKAKAPKIVLPPKYFSTKDLYDKLNLAKKNIEKTKPLPKKSYFIHHVFGILTKKQTLHFLGMHTKHHLKIVKDILKSPY